MKVDSEKNTQVSEMPADIAAAESKVRVLVVLTNEELAIARESFQTLNKLDQTGEKENIK